MSFCPWRTPTQQWWTEADRAELDLVCWELVKAMEAHEANCFECLANPYGCDTVRDLLDAVIEWRDRRLLLTKAQTLRAELEL